MPTSTRGSSAERVPFETPDGHPHDENRHGGAAVAGVGPEAIPVDEYDGPGEDPLQANHMGDDAGPDSNHPDGVRAACPDCQLVALFDSEYEANEAVGDHNQYQHDGADTAGMVKYDLQDLPSAAEIIDAHGLGALLQIAEDVFDQPPLSRASL